MTVASKPVNDLEPVVLALRMQNPSTATESGYFAYFINRSGGTDQYKIADAPEWRADAGTLTSVTGPDAGAGDQAAVPARSATTLELWRQSAGSWVAVPDRVRQPRSRAAGYLAVWARNTAVRLDNFGGGTLP